jgi:uncharacterized membrane protein YphA (DoxX/SURF4 family)
MTVLIVVLKVFVSLTFFAMGCGKLAKVPFFVDQFTEFRLPAGIMYFTGILEIIAVVCLWINVLALWAYSGLAGLMLGALSHHVGAKHSLPQLLPAACMFCLCVIGAFLSL